MKHFISVFLLTFFILSCGSDSKTEDNENTPQTSSFKYEEFYNELQKSAIDFPFESGDWGEDFGDAAFYGLAFYLNAGKEQKNEQYQQFAVSAKERNLAVIKKANNDFFYFVEDLEEVLMAELGLIEYISITGDTSNLKEVDALLDLTNDNVDSFGTYLEIDIDSYALKTYGPTAITGVVALVNLRYVDLLDTEKEKDRLDYAKNILKTIDEKAYSNKQYNFDSKQKDKLYLYPNVILTMANALAFKLTKDEQYKQKGIEVFDSIQELKDQKLQCYYSPYSAEYMGAKTSVYSTLSSQNYAIMAFSLMYEITKDEKFKTEILNVIEFVKSYLCKDGKIYHHWMDGRLALPEDPEYFCTGCNLQFLYAIWYAKKFVFVETGVEK